MRPHHAAFVFCWAAVVTLSIVAPARAPAAPDEGGVVQVTPLEGEPVEGRLLHLDRASVRLATADGTRAFALDGVRGITRPDRPGNDLADREHLRVRLTGGGLLLGTYAGATAEGFALLVPEVGRVELPLEVVATLVVVPAEAGPCFAPEDRLPTGEDDVVHARSGDEIRGILLAVDDAGCEVETSVRGRTRRIPWDDVLVVHLRNDPAPPPADLRIEVETREGSRLEPSGAILTKDGAASFALRSSPRTRVRVPLAHIVAIRPSGGAFVYATTLPFENRHTWFYGGGDMSRWFPTRVDRRAGECPLRLAGRTYRHGFAVQSHSTLTIATSGDWTRFESLFGVDDIALEEAQFGRVVDARVLGDGEVLWEAKGVRAGEAPRRVGPLDISSVQSLVLEVDFGAEGPLEVAGDRATWADPLLFR